MYEGEDKSLNDGDAEASGGDWRRRCKRAAWRDTAQCEHARTHAHVVSMRMICVSIERVDIVADGAEFGDDVIGLLVLILECVPYASIICRRVALHIWHLIELFEEDVLLPLAQLLHRVEHLRVSQSLLHAQVLDGSRVGAVHRGENVHACALELLVRPFQRVQISTARRAAAAAT